ncbi:MAG TPA: trypsin-like peptidase domain-containing protein [Casimicrobiaceae bacterium]
MTQRPSARIRVATAIAVAAIALPAVADVPITAVPPADYRPRAAAKAASAKFLLAPGVPARRIALSEPAAAERAVLQARNAAARSARGARPKSGLAVAFPREIPPGSEAFALDRLNWQALPGGGHAAKIEIASPDAAALRVALKLAAIDPGVTFRFSGNGERAQVFPVPASAVASDTARFGMFWSPVLEGDVATLEVDVDAGVGIPSATLSIAKISHQVVAPGALRGMSAKAVQDIGSSGSCNIDVACVTPQTTAFVDAARAVAATEQTHDDGYTYLCTGQLLNDSVASNTPYFFAANHCLDSAGAARTLNTFWFFEASRCGSTAVPSYVQQAAGATMLARSADWDWALVRLNAEPPAGTRLSAWRAGPIAPLTPVTVFHHPGGDLEKWSEGFTHGYELHPSGASFAQVQYSQGTTEPGSSGAGLLTYFGPGGYYELRGGLWQGAAACDNPLGIDEYSRLDSMLPLTRQYLTPDSPGTPGQAVAVEFYNRTLDHYFITISPGEIDDLDSGLHAGWERTGLRFLAFRTQAPGTNPVCRFYRTPGAPGGDSHFYSASPSECQTVIDHPKAYPGWTYESGSVFYIALPDPASGGCAAGMQPIWRFFNRVTTNHRYTTDHAVRDAMRAHPATWQPEGYPPDNIIMCAPGGA